MLAEGRWPIHEKRSLTSCTAVRFHKAQIMEELSIRSNMEILQYAIKLE